MDEHDLFLQSLSTEEEQLILIRDFLYEGDWAELVRDLEARQSGKPFVFKLNTRIEEDLNRIEKLKDYEKAHSVDLGTCLVRGGKFPELTRNYLEQGERPDTSTETSGARGPSGKSS